LEGETWSRLEKLFIDSQFSCSYTNAITKVKVKGQRGFENTFIVKVTVNEKDHFFSMTQELQLQWFIHVVCSKIPENSRLSFCGGDFLSACEGNIYKKSSFFGEWEKCYAKITQ
jgi:hypothetical protein